MAKTEDPKKKTTAAARSRPRRPPARSARARTEAAAAKAAAAKGAPREGRSGEEDDRREGDRADQARRRAADHARRAPRRARASARAGPRGPAEAREGRRPTAPDRARGRGAAHRRGRLVVRIDRSAGGIPEGRVARRDAVPGVHRRPRERAPGDGADEEPRTRRGRRQEAVEPEGHRPRASGQHPLATVASRWRRLRSERTAVRAAHAREDAPRRVR